LFYWQNIPVSEIQEKGFSQGFIFLAGCLAGLPTITPHFGLWQTKLLVKKILKISTGITINLRMCSKLSVYLHV